MFLYNNFERMSFLILIFNSHMNFGLFSEVNSLQIIHITRWLKCFYLIIIDIHAEFTLIQ